MNAELYGGMNRMGDPEEHFIRKRARIAIVNDRGSCKSPYHPSTGSGRTDNSTVTSWYSVRGELVEP